MKKTLSLLTAGLLITGMLSGCKNTSSGSDIRPDTTESITVSSVTETQGSDTEYNPVTIETMGEKITYDVPPERIVVLGYDLAEMIVMLGEGDRIIALAPCMYLLEDVKEEYQSEIGEIEVLADGMSTGVPTLETVLSKNPDFVLGYSYSFYENAAGAAADYISNDINFYATEGTYVSGANIQNTYNDFLNLGRILGKEAEAEKIVSDMKSRVEAVEASVKDKEPVSVFVYDGGNVENLLSIGGVGFQNSLVTLAGGKNIFSDIESDFANVSVEYIIERDPEVIVIVEYYKADAGKEKIDYINSLPELQSVKAVKNQNFIVISGYSFFPCAQNVDLIEQLAAGFYSDSENN